MSKNVLVDIDDVLAPTQEKILAYINRRARKPLMLSDITGDFLNNKPHEYDLLRKEFFSTPKLVIDIPLYPHVKMSLQKLKRNGCDIHIASSRKEYLRPTIEKWLQKKSLLSLISKIHYRQKELRGDDFKANIARLCRMKAAFEDRADIVEAIASTKTRVYVIDKPWNRKISLNKHITRAADFTAAVDHFLTKRT